MKEARTRKAFKVHECCTGVEYYASVRVSSASTFDIQQAFHVHTVLIRWADGVSVCTQYEYTLHTLCWARLPMCVMCGDQCIN